ncbi:MAG TPA: peptidylprolyl isomerase [Desulfobacterales bacterium]|nr:peptidylprolyl isomerase [Desulfobacterales bacterium]
MKLLQVLMVAGLIMFTAGFSSAAAPGGRADGLYARMITSKGDILLRLYFKKAPLAVANFVGLAQGSKDSNRGKGVPFYNGLTFHRVIKNFMIQGGDPQGNGRGGPGYKFPDEFNSSLRFDNPGVLAMANAGPDTNGSQFFITRVATPWLNGKHTIFGRVVEGQDVVNAIRQGDKIKEIKIVRQGAAARAFKCDQQAFDKLLAQVKSKILKTKEKKERAVEKIIAEKWPKAITTPSGLKYVVVRKGHGPTPKPGTVLTVNYTGRLLNGTKFDSSVDRGQPFRFPVGEHRVIKGWDEAFLGMRKGEKRILIIPPQLGYGARGAGRVIPPNATLVFDVELLDF